jgi:hypothetical protein
VLLLPRLLLLPLLLLPLLHGPPLVRRHRVYVHGCVTHPALWG